MGEVSFHKEMKQYFSNEIKYTVWSYGEPEGKVKVYADPTG
jgi:hypothetical protein